MKIGINEEIEIPSGYSVTALLVGRKNGCCPGRPVVVTQSPAGMYSAQCACGGYCTSGYASELGAELEWIGGCGV